jgi:hypothetical protein
VKGGRWVRKYDVGGGGGKLKMHLDIWDSTCSVPTPQKIAGKFLACPRRKTFFRQVNMEYLCTCKLCKYSILSRV